MKKRYILVLFLVFFLFVSGCNNKRMKRYERKELLFWHAMGGPMGKVLDELVQRYNATNPEYKIDATYKGGYSSLIQSLLAGIPARSLPDISQAYESWTSKLIDNEIIVPMQPYYDKYTEEEKADFYKVLLDNNTFNGKLWSVPFNKSVPIMYYNKEMFKKYGIEPPEKWNTDPSKSEFDKICKLLTVDADNDGTPNQWGYAFNVSVWMWQCFTLQAGGKITNDTETKPLFQEDPGVEALKWWKSLMDREYAFKTQGYDFQNNFAAGNVGMIMASSVSKFFIKPKLTFELGITEVPGFKRKAVVLSGTNLVMLKNSPERQVAAWKFLKWLMSPEVTAEWALRTNYLPVRKSALETDQMKKAVEDDPTILVPLKELEYAHFAPRSSAWYNCRNILSEAIDMIMLGILKPREGLEDAAEKIESELSK